MEIVFSIILLFLVLLFYLSNPKNKTNKWCTIAGMLFWLGVFKESVMYNIIPALSEASQIEYIQNGFMPVYSACTWALYLFAMPAAVIFSLHFCDMDKTHPQMLKLVKISFCIPALILSFFFPPLEFRDYQTGSIAFWYCFAAYNLSFGMLFTILMIHGVKSEKNPKAKRQKRHVKMVVLPPVIFWAASIFLTHPFQISKLFKVWQINAVILLACIIMFFVMAFRDGIMGLKLSGETYVWNSDMNIINTGAEYTGHMIKNQTSKMELCIQQLYGYFDTENRPEELAILSRSIKTLKNYVDKMKRHSQSISLMEEPCRLSGLIDDAILQAGTKQNIKVYKDIPDSIFWLCDKGHITEALANIITNAVEAIGNEGIINIFGEYEKTGYLLYIKDTGPGIDEDHLKRIFTPYFTTKSTEKNFGLGLAYCKNVINKHGGDVTVLSGSGEGTTVIITLPVKRLVEKTEAIVCVKK